MSKKFLLENYLELVNKIYPNNNIKIIEWNGYTKELKYQCDICGQTHSVNDARNLLSTSNYCKQNLRTNVKMTEQEFKRRIAALHNNVEILEYTGLSNLCKYRCNICGGIKTINPARGALHKFSMCNECDGTEKNIVKNKIDAIFNNNENYELLSYLGVKNKAKIKCLHCGEIFERYPSNIIASPDVCPNCNNGGIKQKLNINEVQNRLDMSFGENRYTIVDYKGQLSKESKVKCNNCGFIFNTQISTFSDTRGCPKCARFKSKGEKMVEAYLQENNIKYVSQKRFKDCNNNLSSFDFCAYDKNDIMYLIEVNGVQHYKEVPHFGELSTIQRRDNIKQEYCKNHNIQLIIIPYYDLENKKIDSYLSFLKGSTTISKESR